MKKPILIIALTLILIPLAALSFSPAEWRRVSAEKTADASIATTSGYFYGISVQTDGVNPVWIDIYDSDQGSLNDASGGAKLIPQWIVTTSGIDRFQEIDKWPPVAYESGIFVDVSTGGTVKYEIYYHKK